MGEGIHGAEVGGASPANEGGAWITALSLHLPAPASPSLRVSLAPQGILSKDGELDNTPRQLKQH